MSYPKGIRVWFCLCFPVCDVPKWICIDAQLLRLASRGVVAHLAGPAQKVDELPALLETYQRGLAALFDQVELLALPTLPIFPPRLDAITPESMMQVVIEITNLVALFNAAGVPASAQPVPIAGSAVPGSLQLVGPRGAEELLLATAARVEAALGGR